MLSFYVCVRIVIVIGLLFLWRLLFRKYELLRKQSGRMIGIVCFFVIAFALSVVPFENAFVSFDTPERIYGYHGPIGVEVQLVVEGDTSVFVTGERDRYHYPKIYPKNGGKYSIGAAQDIISSFYEEDFAVYIYHLEGTEEYYVSVEMLWMGDTEPREITDGLGSEFIQIPDEDDFRYIVCVPNLDMSYVVTVDGVDYPLAEMDDLNPPWMKDDIPA